MKEWGGYLPIDSRGVEYFDFVAEKNVLKLNAARYAIVEACKIGGFSKLWIPVYMCASVMEAIKADGHIEYGFYNIGEDFEPEIREIGESECILASNYYGQKREDYFERQIWRFGNVIFDNTQCFFANPIIRQGVFNVYSPRKFFGASDGAYLIGSEVNCGGSYELDSSAQRMGFIMEALEKGTNAGYSDHLGAENELALSGVKAMSRVTAALLGNIDYEGIRERRSRNYRVLCERFDDFNELKTDMKAGSPMIYPLLLKDAGLRKCLVDIKIYIPQWWKIVIDHPKANEWEKYVSENLYPLPIDQRYTEQDMDELSRIIRSKLG